MRVEQQPAFILHARAWRESSLLLEVLSREYGRVGLVARSVRSARSRTPRAVLQPLIPLCLSWSGRGELATLTDAEAIGATLALGGESLLCAMYTNELIARLVPRHDPHPELFASYLETLARLAQTDPPAWSLRRFERDLLAHLGYGLQLDGDAESGEALQAQANYAYRLDAGPVLWRRNADGLKLRGSALLALASDVAPDARDLVALRHLLRALIEQRLDGVPLRAWSLTRSRRQGAD